MTTYESILTIDFGEVGYRSGKSPFRVRLETGPLAELIRATESAHRVYELFLIDRPGDVWDYVWVILDEVPTRVADRVGRAGQQLYRHHQRQRYPRGRSGRAARDHGGL